MDNQRWLSSFSHHQYIFKSLKKWIIIYFEVWFTSLCLWSVYIANFINHQILSRTFNYYSFSYNERVISFWLIDLSYDWREHLKNFKMTCNSARLVGYFRKVKIHATSSPLLNYTWWPSILESNLRIFRKSSFYSPQLFRVDNTTMQNNKNRFFLTQKNVLSAYTGFLFSNL